MRFAGALGVALLLLFWPLANDEHGSSAGSVGSGSCLVVLIVLALVALGKSVFRRTTAA